MSRWSVWNQATGLFDYYESSREQRGMNVEKPRHLRASQTLGASAEQAAWPLPSDARKVGSGSHAVGRVASRSSASGMAGLGGVSDSIVNIGTVVLIGALFWRYVLHPKRGDYR